MTDPEISMVYFDVGGVLIDDFNGNDGWSRFCAELGVDESQKDDLVNYWMSRESQLCTTLEVDEMRPLLEERYGANFAQDRSLLNLFVDNFKPNPTIHDVVRFAQQRSKIGLLTNMFPRMLTAIEEAGLLPNGIDWDVVVDSSEVHAVKPTRRIFEVAAKRCRVQPSEIFFIDNREENLVIPREMGWQTHFFDSTALESSSCQLLQKLSLVL